MSEEHNRLGRLFAGHGIARCQQHRECDADCNPSPYPRSSQPRPAHSLNRNPQPTIRQTKGPHVTLSVMLKPFGVMRQRDGSPELLHATCRLSSRPSGAGNETEPL